MSYYSGFISQFSEDLSTNLSTNDILTSVSVQKSLTVSGLSTGYKGRYFVLGNLLIQFSDFSSGLPSSSSPSTSSYSIYYPYQYDTTPYCVILTPFEYGGTSYPCNITLTSFSTSRCNFIISNNSGIPSFIVIGPRPSSL